MFRESRPRVRQEAEAEAAGHRDQGAEGDDHQAEHQGLQEGAAGQGGQEEQGVWQGAL